jgi:hypothetical protein
MPLNVPAPFSSSVSETIPGSRKRKAKEKNFLDSPPEEIDTSTLEKRCYLCSAHSDLRGVRNSC